MSAPERNALAFDQLRTLTMVWDVSISCEYAPDGTIWTVKITRPEYATRPSEFTYTGLDLATQIARAYAGERGDGPDA